MDSDIMVGIISFNKYSKHMNYGAALHSYAFQTYLHKKGINSLIIDYVPKSLEGYNIKYPILNNLNIWKIKSFSLSLARWTLGFISNIVKYDKFERFFEQNYKLTNECYTQKRLLSSLKIDNLNFSAFVCESDVIWKTWSTGGTFDEIFFLNFPAAKGKKKIAYAPTLGSKIFSEKEIKKLKNLTADFSAISTRERQGAEYLKTLLNKEVPWVVDPTLLLYQSDYEKIIIDTQEKNYLLVYNCMLNDKKMLRQATLLAKKMKLELIEVSIFSENRLFFSHKIKNNIGIEEFLGLFKNASFVICNAFHGCCFSLIYKKDFFLFLRDSSDYRMKNLTDALDISDRLIHYDNKYIPSSFDSINFNEVEKKLEVLRKKSFKFIKENLGNL